MPTTLDLLGSQTPTHLLVPADADYSVLDEVLDLVASGMVTQEGDNVELDPWQRDFLELALGRTRIRGHRGASSRWAAAVCAIELSRQNGKSLLLELRVLAGLFLWDERYIVYSAHKGSTALEEFNKISALIESSPALNKRVGRRSLATGREAIILKNGHKVEFKTRSLRAKTMRGPTASCYIIDEAQDATDEHMAALLPSMSGRSIVGDPQLWYAGSAGDLSSEVLGRLVRRQEAESALRDRGEEPQDRRFMMGRWAADLDVDRVDDPEVIARTNPALGRRISMDWVLDVEFRDMNAALDPVRFARERLGVGTYPHDEGTDWPIPQRRFEAAEDPASEAVGAVVFAVEVSWDRQSAVIGVAGWRSDGDVHFEVVARELGTAWAVAEIARLTSSHENLGVVVDPAGPANTLIGPLRDAGVNVLLLKVSDLTKAWGGFFDRLALEKPSAHHRGGLILTSHMAAAELRDIQGSKTWKRSTADDSSGAIAVTWAIYMLEVLRKPVAPPASSRRRINQFEEAADKRYRPRRGFDPRNSSF